MILRNGVRADARKLFESMAMMMIGACVWFVGFAGGLFDWIARFALSHGLADLLSLCVCICLGAVVAIVRVTLQLRRAVAARMAAEAVAERLARQDPLTGLGNRRCFNESLRALLDARGEGEGFAVILIDLDRFKPVNDLHGHAAGNAVLCAVAERLKRLTTPGGIVARLGGDEFVALAPGLSDEARVGALAQAMIEAIRLPIPWGVGAVDVDATIGLAIASADLHDPEALLRAADVAMYSGKREGRGVWRVFRTEMDQELRRRAQLESELRGAIPRGDIIPHFQPIVSLSTRKLAGFEVLARWPHPALGDVPPQTFIAIAEECGLISDLFERLLATACRQARAWPHHLTLSVNISQRQLQDPGMPGKVLSVLTQCGFPARRLEVEFTEKALLADVEQARVALTSLQNLGVRLALDDFGSGYSILAHLNDLRFAKLKIDRSFVAAQESGEPATLLDAILKLGSSLRVETTAEGIESQESLRWLAARACSYGQGFLFGRAMSRVDAEAYIEASKRSGGAIPQFGAAG